MQLTCGKVAIFHRSFVPLLTFMGKRTHNSGKKEKFTQKQHFSRAIIIKCAIVWENERQSKNAYVSEWDFNDNKYIKFVINWIERCEGIWVCVVYLYAFSCFGCEYANTLMCLFYICNSNVERIFDWLIVFRVFFIRWTQRMREKS